MIWWRNPVCQESRLALALQSVSVKMPPREKPNTQADEFRRIVSVAERSIARAWDVFLEDGDLDKWTSAMMDALRDGHSKAYRLGRLTAGDDVADYEADAVGRAIADLESYYLQGFRNDLAAGAYEGKDQQGLHRAITYTGRMRGTANGGFVDGTPSGVELELFWILGGEDNCEDCPVFAEASPYRKDTIPTVPGGNATPCLFHCNCRLVRSDGATGFDRDE